MSRGEKVIKNNVGIGGEKEVERGEERRNQRC